MPSCRRICGAPSIDALIPLLYLKGIATNAFPDALRAIPGRTASSG